MQKIASGRNELNEHNTNKRKKGCCVSDQPAQNKSASTKKNACCLNGRESRVGVSVR